MIRSVLRLMWLVTLGALMACQSDSGNPADPAGDSAAEPRVIRYGDDSNNQGVLRLPDGQPDGRWPVAVLIHGGFWAEPWDTSLMSAMAQDLNDHGIATWNIEYRRTGGRGGWPQTGHDVRDAIAHLALLGDDEPIDLERVVLVGHSAGGHLALWAIEDAAQNGGPVQPRRAVGLATVTDLDAFPIRSGRLMGEPREANPEAWDDAQPQVNADQVVLVHGDRDEDVPLPTIDNARRNGVEPVVIEGLGHMGIIEPNDSAWPQIRSVILTELD